MGNEVLQIKSMDSDKQKKLQLFLVGKQVKLKYLN